MRAQQSLDFPVLSDPKREAIRGYRVVDPDSNPFLNPRGHANIARPSVFVIDGAGVIRWKYIGENAADRPSPATILDKVRSVAGKNAS